MKYLVIDASLNGTGIRDKYNGGYLVPEELGISRNIIDRLNRWLLEYETEHYKGFVDDYIIDKLDQEGKEIALMVKIDLSEVKMEYFSDAKMTNEMI